MKGICRRVLIFMLIETANILDVQFTNMDSVLCTAIIFFYISNEGVSLTENIVASWTAYPRKVEGSAGTALRPQNQ